MAQKKPKKTPRPKPKEKDPKRRPLTGRQSLFVEAYMQTRNAARAAVMAGYSPHKPNQAGYQVLKQIQKKVPGIMGELNLDVRRLIDIYLLPLLNASMTKFAVHEGEITDSVDCDDNYTRLRSLDMAFRLLGAYKPKEQITKEASQVQVVILDMPHPPEREHKVNGNSP